MRILHVNKFLYRRGGAEGYLLDVADLQRHNGHDVQLWGMEHPDNLPDLPLRRTFAPYIELEPAPGGLAGLSGAARMVWSRSSKQCLEHAIQRFRPDVVHLHNIYHQLSPSILPPLARAGVPMVMTLHDYKLACPSYQMLDHGKLCERCVRGGTWNATRQRCKGDSLAASAALTIESGIHRMIDAYRPVDLFISPSRFLAQVMTRTGLDPRRIRVVNHFTPLDDLTPSTSPGEGFVFAGRLSQEKGVDTLIEAVGLASHEVRLDIAGDGPERVALERLAAAKAAGRVRFHGRLDKPAVGALVAGARACIVPSRWYENQPMTILESFAAGVAVVATDLGGMPELVGHEREGLLVVHDDPAALAAAMNRLQADAALASRLGRTARSRILKDFSARTHLDALVDAYGFATAVRHRRGRRKGVLRERGATHSAR